MFNFTIIGVGHLVIAAVLTYDILLTKHRPVSAVLWLGVVWGFPYLGALGYLSFGMDRLRRRAADREAARALVAQHAEQHPTFARLTVDYSLPTPSEGRQHPAEHIFRATDPAVRDHRVIQGNRAQLLVDGDQFYPALAEAISSATSSVHLLTYIYGRDHIGKELLELMIERAKAGVEVRLLYDRFGSSYAHFSRFFEPARRSGLRVSSISQANPLKGRFQINLRNHRKIAIIDGLLAFAGGINIHDPNLSSYSNGRPIRDYHVRLEGPAVADVQFQFVEDWHFATGEPPEELLETNYFPQIEPMGNALVQIVPGGPEQKGRGLADAFFGAIVSAQRSVVILTPYFVPDEPIVHAIRFAARHGADVKLIVPKHNNHWYTGFAARSLYSPLLEAGVRIFERKPPFMHAKALLVDDVYAMLGSANLDYRSLQLNFETNLEIVDHAFVGFLREQIEGELSQSEEVTYAVHQKRPITRRLAENFCFLLQPML